MWSLHIDVTQEEIITYLSSLPLKERVEICKSLFDKDKDNLVSKLSGLSTPELTKLGPLVIRILQDNKLLGK